MLLLRRMNPVMALGGHAGCDPPCPLEADTAAATWPPDVNRAINHCQLHATTPVDACRDLNTLTVQTLLRLPKTNQRLWTSECLAVPVLQRGRPFTAKHLSQPRKKVLDCELDHK
jgi:hypothetical protein